jgi:prolyl oligopeptidase PreP (S9A serine peptidase family)
MASSGKRWKEIAVLFGRKETGSVSGVRQI